jgi:hypothetical protein
MGACRDGATQHRETLASEVNLWEPAEMVPHNTERHLQVK